MIVREDGSLRRNGTFIIILSLFSPCAYHAFSVIVLFWLFSSVCMVNWIIVPLSNRWFVLFSSRSVVHGVSRYNDECLWYFWLFAYAIRSVLCCPCHLPLSVFRFFLIMPNSFAHDFVFSMIISTLFVHDFVFYNLYGSIELVCTRLCFFYDNLYLVCTRLCFFYDNLYLVCTRLCILYFIW
jgi:hypothetical protein